MKYVPRASLGYSKISFLTVLASSTHNKMIIFTGSDMSGIRKKSELTRSVPISVPNSSCASSTVRSGGGGGGEPVHEEQPRFCVCLQHMPEPTLSQDWFDMQPTQEMNGGQVSLIDG